MLVTQSCPTLCDPMDCRLPGRSVHGINQAGRLEWVAISFSRGIFPTQGSNLGLLHRRQTLLPEPPGKVSDVMEQNKNSPQFPEGKTQRAFTAWPDLCNLPSCSSGPGQLSSSAGRGHPSWALLMPCHLSRMPLVQRKSSDALRPNSNASSQ